MPLSITRAMARLVNELKIPTVSSYDLRRSVGREMARLRIAVRISSLVLNHSPQCRGITVRGPALLVVVGIAIVDDLG